MALKMLTQGHPVYFYENIEGGHGGAADLKQRIFLDALERTFLCKVLLGKLAD
jgi:prolyl oligopeptidase